jgi:hypothetical protein
VKVGLSAKKLTMTSMLISKCAGWSERQLNVPLTITEMKSVLQITLKSSISLALRPAAGVGAASAAL